MLTMIKRAFEVAKNTFDMIIMGKMRIMHIDTSLLHNIRELKTNKCKILKCTSTAIKSSIRKWFTIKG
jgi:hypothetical protein